MPRLPLVIAVLAATIIIGSPLRAMAQSVAQPITTSIAASSGAEKDPSSWFARVNGVEITTVAFDREAREAFRRKFFHGTPPESEVNQMLRVVGNSMIDTILLKDAAKAEKVAANQAEVDAEINRLEARFGANSDWRLQRDQVLPGIRAHFEDQSRIRDLEKKIRSEPVSEAEVKAFYDSNLALFTEPVQNKVSLILLSVHPSSPWSEWENAEKKAAAVLAELTAGAEFEKVAKEKSRDRSASNGGNLGYLHEGMLAPAVEAELAKLKVGQIGGPTRTLEGYVLYRLDDRLPPKVHDFVVAEPRARERAAIVKSDSVWANYLANLRSAAKVEIGPAFVGIMQAPTTSAVKQ